MMIGMLPEVFKKATMKRLKNWIKSWKKKEKPTKSSNKENKKLRLFNAIDNYVSTSIRTAINFHELKDHSKMGSNDDEQRSFDHSLELMREAEEYLMLVLKEYNL